MLPLFYVALVLAAGSDASPCKPSASSSAPSVAGSGGAATPGGGASSGGATAGKDSAAQAVGANNNLAGLSTPSNTSGSGLILPPHYSNSASATASTATASIAPVSGGGSCPEGFINAVFNTNAPKNGGWPGTTWTSLSEHGVNNWSGYNQPRTRENLLIILLPAVGFSLGTLDTNDHYLHPPVNPALNAAQIHVVMDGNDTDAAIELVQSANAPVYLELFNEPDFSFEGKTALIDAIPAAQNLSKLFSTPHPKTTFISPALMNAESDWLSTFKENCNGCFDQIPIIAQHLYNPDVDGAMTHIRALHGKWPDKKIWITELSPASADCKLDAAGIAVYMNTLLPQIIKLGYVEKIFWNSAEWSLPAINNAPESCNPSLTDANGNPTAILKSLQNVCAGSGGTATA